MNVAVDTLHWIPVRGESMWPALRSGDQAGFSATGVPEVGKVVVARVGRRILVHRVVSVRGEELILQGDNCRRSDPLISARDIFGVVTHVRRGGRTLDASLWDSGPRPLGPWRLGLWRRVRQVLGVFS